MAAINQHRLQIPVFDPEKNDISAKAWMNLVDLGRQAAGKTAATAATAPTATGGAAAATSSSYVVLELAELVSTPHL